MLRYPSPIRPILVVGLSLACLSAPAPTRAAWVPASAADAASTLSALADPVGPKAVVPPKHAIAAGSIFKSMVALNQAMDVWRGVLVEWVPAYHTLLAQGQRAKARGDDAIDPFVRGLFRKSDAALRARMDLEALTPVPAALHQRAQSGVARLAAATTLRQVGQPLSEILTALTQLLALTEDLASWAEPHTQAPDTGPTRDAGQTLNDAWSALTLAEIQVRGAQHEGLPKSPLRPAMLQLQESLRRALALPWPVSVRSSAHHAFDPNPDALSPWAMHAASLSQHISDLDAVLATLKLRPASVQAALDVALVPYGQTRAQVAAELTMTLAADANDDTRPFAIVMRRPSGAYDGVSDVIGTVTAHDKRFVYHHDDAAGMQAEWAFAIVDESPFGVLGRCNFVVAVPRHRHLQPASALTATALAPAFDDRAFYRDLDAVRLSWTPSPSDVAAAPALSPWFDVPRVVRYDVYRLSAQASAAYSQDEKLIVDRGVWCGAVKPGVTSFVDRPGPDRLAGGVVYRVIAVGDDDALALAGASPPVRLDLDEPLRLARAGAQALPSPSRTETALARALGEPGPCARAKAQFLSHGPRRQRAEWQAFWHGLGDDDKREAYGEWPNELDVSTDAQSASVPAIRHLHVPFVHGAIFLRDHPALDARVAEHWDVLDDAGRAEATLSFLGLINEAAQKTVADDKESAVWVRRWAFLLNNDQEEWDDIERAWRQNDAQAQHERLSGWLKELPITIGASVMWPSWQHLSQEERRKWLFQAPQQTPKSVWPKFLAHMAFVDMPLDARAAAISREVGFWAHGPIALRYWARPLDKALGFKLAQALTIMGLGLLAGVLLHTAGAPKIQRFGPDEDR